MAWSWSHTQEAYDNARANLEFVSTEDLADAAASWKILKAARAIDPDVWAHEVEFGGVLHGDWKAEFLRMDRESLENYVWNNMSDAATCDNGGFNAWVDPEGYIMVSFSRGRYDEETV